MEKGLKTSTFPERSPVKVHCSVESHSKSLFSKSNVKLTIIREGWKNKTLSEILSSQCSSVHAKKNSFFDNPATKFCQNENFSAQSLKI